MKKKLLITSLVVTLSTILVSLFFPSKDAAALRCSGKYRASKLLSPGNNLSLNMDMFIYISKDGYGIALQKGEVTSRGHTYLINRELSYVFKKKAKVLPIKKIEIKKRKNDNTPDEISHQFAILDPHTNTYYIKITKINEDISLISEINQPLFLCKKNH